MVVSYMNESTLETSNLSDTEATDTLNTEKWGVALNDGFLVIPVALLRHQHALKLNDGEVVVLLNLLASWWGINELPYIQTSSIAKRMGVSRRTAQRQVESLEVKGFIKRIWSKDALVERAGASYDLSDTVFKLKEFGQFGRAERKINVRVTAQETAKELT